MRLSQLYLSCLLLTLSARRHRALVPARQLHAPSQGYLPAGGSGHLFVHRDDALGEDSIAEEIQRNEDRNRVIRAMVEKKRNRHGQSHPETRFLREVMYQIRRKKLDRAAEVLWANLGAEDITQGARMKGLGMAVDALARKGRMRDAENLTSDFCESAGLNRTLPLMNSLIHGYGSKRWPDRALATFKLLPKYGLVPDHYCYATITLALARAGWASEARALYRQMLEDGLPPSLIVLNGIMDGVAKAGMADEAQSLLVEFRSGHVTPDNGTYTSLLLAHVNAGDTATAERILDHLEARIPSGSGTPDVITYGILLTHYGRSGMLDEALAMMDRIRTRGLKPNCHIYASLLSVAGIARRPDVLLELWGQLERDGLRKTDAVTQVMMRALFRCGKGHEADRLHTELTEGWKRHLDAKAKTRVGAYTSNNGEMLAVDGDEGDVSEVPSRPTPTTFMALAECYARHLDFEKARETLKVAQTTPGCTPPVSAWKIIVRGARSWAYKEGDKQVFGRRYAQWKAQREEEEERKRAEGTAQTGEEKHLRELEQRHRAELPQRQPIQPPPASRKGRAPASKRRAKKEPSATAEELLQQAEALLAKASASPGDGAGALEEAQVILQKVVERGDQILALPLFARLRELQDGRGQEESCPF